MDIRNVCKNYFHGFQDLSNWKNNTAKTNTLIILKLLSYLSGIIPLIFGMTYQISSLSGRVKKKGFSLQQVKQIRDQALQNLKVKKQTKSDNENHKGSVEKINYSKPFEYCLSSAQEGNVQAQMIVADFYNRGNFIEKNVEQSFKYFKMAADSGNPIAQFKVAVMYENGTGVEKNVENSFKYFKMAADNESTNSQFNVAVMYEQGRGVPVNLKEAIHYYQLAAKKGDKEAQERLDKMRAAEHA